MANTLCSDADMHHASTAPAALARGFGPSIWSMRPEEHREWPDISHFRDGAQLPDPSALRVAARAQAQNPPRPAAVGLGLGFPAEMDAITSLNEFQSAMALERGRH